MTLPHRIRILALGLVLAHLGRGHDFTGWCWPSGSIRLELQLDATGGILTQPLMDGSTSWNAVAEAAMNEWNAALVRSRFTPVRAARTTSERSDGVSSVIFASTAYGMAFPNRALALTYSVPLDNDSDQVRLIEADVLVNREYAWNSYRGAYRSDPVDLRRVLLHEFGHVLGLDHPDEATPAQNVNAIMNSTLGNIDTLQADDRAGVAFLYNTPFAKPTITTQPESQTVNAGGTAILAIAVDGRSPPLTDRFRSTRWFFKAAGAADYELLFTIHQPGALDFSLAQPSDSGSYFYRVTTPDDTVDSNVATLTVNAVPNTSTTALANLSTRGVIDNDPVTMFMGFVIAGPRAKTVLLRGIGSSLRQAPFNLRDVVSHPRITLRNSAGATVVTSPPAWGETPNAAAINQATARVGAFPVSPGSLDAIILATLEPGSYTAEVSRGLGSGGLVLMEAYDADVTPDPASRLMNLSTRGWVDTADRIMIGGFVVRGPGPRTYLVRASGDTLKSFGVSRSLDDPYLKIFRGDGTLVRELDDWDSPSSSQPALRAAFTQVGAFGFSDRQESAMLVTLPPGNYTAQIHGLDSDGRSNPTGVALMEIYEMP